MQSCQLTLGRFLLSLVLLSISMSIQAGNFFPPDYKVFAFREGDLLVGKAPENGLFSVVKVLKVDRLEIKRGSYIGIQGKKFIATEDDYLLVIGCALGEREFRSFNEASAAAKSGKWTVAVGHVPNRTPGAADGMVKVGSTNVNPSELEGYKLWKAAFDKGEAGIF